MVLGGLWHGAAIRFVLWGTLHGVALALHKLWLSVVPGAKVSGYQMHPLSRLAGILVTFHLVCFGWLLFRARGAGLSAAHAPRPRRRRGTPRGGRLALLGAGVAARLRGMGRHADPVEQHPTLHLLPILILR